MRLPTNRSIHGELLDIRQACQVVNMGEKAVRQLVAESGAGRKIGRSFRIRMDVLLDYIDKNFAV